MHKHIITILFFLCTINTATCMELLPDIQKQVLELLTNPVLIITISDPNEEHQKELIRHLYLLSRINNTFYASVNGAPFIQALFKALPYKARYPLCCRLILKSFCSDYNDLLYGNSKCTTIVRQNFAQAVRNRTRPRAIENYFLLSKAICSDIFKLDHELIKSFLDDVADPNFYMDCTHVGDNFPPALYGLAADSSPESLKKLQTLLEHGADVNIDSDISFTLYTPCYQTWEAHTWGHNLQEPTALHIAIANGNEQAVVELLKYKPKKLFIKQAFLSDNASIKQNIMNHRTLTQEELDEGLSGALIAQNKDDVAVLVGLGADVHKVLPTTVHRTLAYCQFSDTYKPFTPYKTSGQPGYTAPNLSNPIPTTDLVKELCKADAYDAGLLNDLKNLVATATEVIQMLEENRPK